jgi:MFS family permease
MSDEKETPDSPPPDEPPSAGPDGEAKANAPWLTLGITSVATASYFSDSGHEIATAILPSFLTWVLHGSAASLGLIEGVSDALTGVAKLIGGPLANDPGRRRTMATGGYLATAIATAAIGLATALWQVGALRAIAWAARGFRSPARDTLLASLAPKRAFGRAFGLERAGDNLGAVAGPLLAAGLVAWLGIRPAIWFALIPGYLAAAAITVAAREARLRHDVSVQQRIRFDSPGCRQPDSSAHSSRLSCSNAATSPPRS